jgi:hypothetical protein
MNTEWLSNVSTVSLVGNQVAYSILTYLFIIWFPQNLFVGVEYVYRKNAGRKRKISTLYIHIGVEIVAVF